LRQCLRWGDAVNRFDCWFWASPVLTQLVATRELFNMGTAAKANPAKAKVTAKAATIPNLIGRRIVIPDEFHTLPGRISNPTLSH
jgi:hypothetical protein